MPSVISIKYTKFSDFTEVRFNVSILKKHPIYNKNLFVVRFIHRNMPLDSEKWTQLRQFLFFNCFSASLSLITKFLLLLRDILACVIDTP